MIQLFKKILDKLDPPANDWVLSRFGGCEAPIAAPSAQQGENVEDEAGPVSEASPLSAHGPFDRWFDEQESVEAGPPQSGEVLSPNASQVPAAERTPERKSGTS